MDTPISETEEITEEVEKESPLAVEQEIYFPKPETIKTIGNDTKHVNQSISWRNQEKIVKIFAVAVKRNPFPSDMNKMGEVVNFAVETLGSVSDDLTAIASIVLEESDDWVRDKLDFDTIMEVVVPFVASIFSTVGKTLPNLTKQRAEGKLVKAMRR